MTLPSINEYGVGSRTPLIWDDTPPDFLAGMQSWDATGTQNEGSQQDGTPWGSSCAQLGPVVARRVSSIALNSNSPTLH